MAKFKLIVSDPGTGKCSVSEIEGSRAQALIGRSLGEVIDGSALGIVQGKAIISGGCDKNGIPMRADVHGGGKKYIVLSSGPGFRPTRLGERRRKLIRGRTITDETYQINFTLKKGEVAKAPLSEATLAQAASVAAETIVPAKTGQKEKHKELAKKPKEDKGKKAAKKRK
jgi:small subunit ribosomal protein S6e